MTHKPAIEPLELRYLTRDFVHGFPRARQMEEAQPDLVEDCIRLQALARRFGDTHVRPYVTEWDKKAGEDHNFVAWDAIRAGTRSRFFSMMIPEAFGGLGHRGPATSVMMEELCAADAGIANVFGAHGLGIVPLVLSLDMRWFFRQLREVTDAEKRGEPVIFALAHTEPGAGSDVEDEEDILKARLTTIAHKAPGGWRLSGSKVFISNGSIARYIWVSAFADKSRPVESGLSFVVPNDAPGFRVGRVERKLGQRLCPAAELVFEDVFVPDADTLPATMSVAESISHALSITRGPVGAIAIGIARGALERTLEYLSQKRERGRWLFEEQWVQLALVDMVSWIQAGRQLYMDSATAVETIGFLKALNPSAQKSLSLLPDRWMRSERMKRLLASKTMTRLMAAQLERTVSRSDLWEAVGLASMAKFMCSDFAMRVCGQAMEILGEDADDPKWGVEKCLRDAKLTQIYEGTNQLNRLHVYKGLIQQKRR